VSVDSAKTEGDTTVLEASGIDRKKERVTGRFEVKQINGEWKVVGGRWREKGEGAGNVNEDSYSSGDNGGAVRISD
jgi:hypothetical protein